MRARKTIIAGLNRVKKMAEDNERDDLPGTAQQQSRSSRLHVRPHGVGRGRLQAGEFAQVKLLYDIYHMQIMEGDVIRTIRDNIQYIGHFHTGGVPGRHELDGTQELNWRPVAQAIADLKYAGFVAHEFIPTRDPMGSLKQAYDVFKT